MSAKLILFAFVGVICCQHFAIGGPTLVPADPFDADKDADIIWNAVHRIGTKEFDINKVLCKRTFKQRLAITQAFEAKHEGTNLLKKLEKETSRDLKKLYRRLLESPAQLLANDLHDYIEGKREDKYGGVTEIICGTDAFDKSQLGAYYMATFNMDVMDHVKKYKGGDEAYQKVLFDFCWRTYCTNLTLDDAKALAAAQYLHSLDCKTDGENFKIALQKYFQSYCLPDLQIIFVKYRSLANRGINEAIRDAIKGKGDEANAWVALALSTEVRYRYYADLLHEAVDGAGTDEDRVFRITLETCERYLGDIDCEYNAIHHESFYDRLSGWTGDFAASFNVKDCMKKLFGK